MKKQYLCPECRSELKVKDYIIFSCRTEKGKQGIIMLNPGLGNYEMLHDHNFTYNEGEHVDYFCPVCHANLAIPDISKDLAEVVMIDEKGDEYKIVFSEIAGKKCTYKLKDDKIVESFGEDADEYTNFWGVGPSYL